MMSAPAEYFDIVDEQDRVIGRASRAEVHARSLRHRAVHVLVFNRRGDLFIQKRAESKDTFPGCYDSSASGHLECGEEYDNCALRELREELGLVIHPEQLRKHFKVAACKETGWEFVWVYSAQIDEQPKINMEEIEEGEFRSLQRVKEMLAEHPDGFASGFTRVFGECCQRGLWPRQGSTGRS